MAEKNKPNTPAKPNDPPAADAPSNLPAVAGNGLAPVAHFSSQSGEITLAGGLVVESIKSVTRPVLRQMPRVAYFLAVESAVYVGKELAGLTKEGQPKEKPADLLDIVNLETGEEMVLIANSVLKSELERAYPDSGYVGRCFAIMSFEPDGERKKRYRTYSIKEIAVKGRKIEKVADVAKPPVHSSALAGADANAEAGATA